MKRLLATLVAAVSLLAGGIAVTAPVAQAQETSVQNSSPTCNPVSSLPVGVSGCKFWTSGSSNLTCIDGSAINGAYYRVAAIAQAWNTAVGSPGVFGLDYSDDCAADGYPPSRRFVIGGYYGAAGDDHCFLQTLTDRVPGTSNFDWWTNGAPSGYVNFNNDCLNSQAKRDHVISAVIGASMGLEYVSGPSTRVMNITGPTTMPDSASALFLYRIYLGYYG
jgi:hypothetical protein